MAYGLFPVHLLISWLSVKCFVTYKINVAFNVNGKQNRCTINIILKSSVGHLALTFCTFSLCTVKLFLVIQSAHVTGMYLCLFISFLFKV